MASQEGASPGAEPYRMQVGDFLPVSAECEEFALACSSWRESITRDHKYVVKYTHSWGIVSVREALEKLPAAAKYQERYVQACSAQMPAMKVGVLENGLRDLYWSR